MFNVQRKQGSKNNCSRFKVLKLSSWKAINKKGQDAFPQTIDADYEIMLRFMHKYRASMTHIS